MLTRQFNIGSKPGTVQFLWACAHCSHRFGSRLTGVEPNAVVFSCGPFTSRLNILCVPKVFSAHCSCKEWLSHLPWPVCCLKPVCPLFSDLSHHQNISVHCSLDVFALELTTMSWSLRSDCFSFCCLISA